MCVLCGVGEFSGLVFVFFARLCRGCLASDVMVVVNEFTKLSRRHGIKVGAGSLHSVEDVALAVGDIVGHSSVKSAAKMNSAVVLFLERVDQVDQLVEAGLSVNGAFEQVLPLTQPATRVTLSNVPPFISDDFLCKELSRHGKVVSPMKKILSGCKSPLLRHVVSHRRNVFMILNNRTEDLNLRFRLRIDECDYVIFATSSFMRCFGCGGEGHMIKTCPQRGDKGRSGPGEADPGEGSSTGGQPPRSRAPSEPERSESADRAGPEERAEPEADGVGERERGEREGGERGGGESQAAGSGEGAVEKETGRAGEAQGGKEGKRGDEQVKEAEEEHGERSVCEEQVGETGEGGAQGGETGEEGAQGGEGGSVCEEQAGETGEGVTEAETACGSQVVEMEDEEEEEKWSLTPRRRRSKRTASLPRAEGVTGKRRERMEVSDSDTEGWLSDSSDVSLIKTNPNSDQKMYSPKMIKCFLQETKNMRKIALENYFPDKKLFYHSARKCTQNTEQSVLDKQEMFRLRKFLGKLRKVIFK